MGKEEARGHLKKAPKGGKKPQKAGAKKGSKQVAKEAEKRKVKRSAKKAERKTSGTDSAKEDGAEDRGLKRKRPADAEEDEPEDGKKGSKKQITVKIKKRKEITKLYSELINPGRERKADEVVEELLKALETRAVSLKEYACTELGTRVVQACLKWGSRQHRSQLLESLKEGLAKLAIDKQGHMMVQKLFTYTMKTSAARKPTKDEIKTQEKNLRTFLEAFRGKPLHQMFYHKHGCRLINAMYYSEHLKTKDKRRLLHDLAVPQAITLMRQTTLGDRTLRQLLKADGLSKDHRSSMLAHLRECIEKATEKEMLGMDIVHLLFQAYCEHATEEQLRDLADKCMAGAPYLLSSKPGADAVLRLLGVATPKQRKALCQDLKGKFAALAMNAVDYVVMIRIACTVDDTVLLTKTMLKEWQPEINDMAFDKYGHKVLAWLLRPDDPKLFSPYERECAALPAPSSMKAPDARRQELARVLRPMVRAVLLAAPMKAAADLHAKALLTAYLAADWDGEIIEALVAAGEAEAAASDLGLLDNGTTTTTLLALLKAEPAGESALSGPLWRRVFEPRLAAVVVGRCSFVMLELLKRESTCKAVAGALQHRHKELEKAVATAEKDGAKVTGARKLLAEAGKG